MNRTLLDAAAIGFVILFAGTVVMVVYGFYVLQ